MKIVLIYNPKSGSALSSETLRGKCQAAGLTVESLLPLGGELAKTLQPFIKKDSTIAAVGGDGTLSLVAGLLADTEAVFAPLPGGTLNHFTKDLGISQDIDEALHQLVRSRIHNVDIASVNDRAFINNSSIGLYPSSLHVRSRFEDSIGKWPAAVIASMRTLVRFRTYDVTIGKETFHTPFIFVGNNDYSIDGVGGITRTHLNKGELTVFVAKTVSRIALLKIMLFALIGRAKELNEFDVYHAQSLVIKARKNRLSVSRDGEVGRMISPLRYKIHPAALRIRF